MGDTMSVIELPRASASTAVGGALASWWDDDAECTVVIARPSENGALWHEYLTGAEHTYRRHGVDAAIDVEAIKRSGDTTLFWTMLDSTGTVIGGVRAVGPLTSPDETHAVVEWAGQTSLPLVRKMIADRLPFGVVEMKTAWVTVDRDRNRQLATSLARTGCQVLAVLGVQFCMATCARHVLRRWQSSGGVVAPIRSTPYPDERFRTKLMWWDRLTVASVAAPQQSAKIVAEMEHIRRRLDITREFRKAPTWSEDHVYRTTMGSRGRRSLHRRRGRRSCCGSRRCERRLRCLPWHYGAHQRRRRLGRIVVLRRRGQADDEAPRGIRLRLREEQSRGPLAGARGRRRRATTALATARRGRTVLRLRTRTVGTPMCRRAKR